MQFYIFVFIYAWHMIKSLCWQYLIDFQTADNNFLVILIFRSYSVEIKKEQRAVSQMDLITRVTET